MENREKIKNRPLAGTKICMLVLNNMVADSRVLKEACSLSNAGAEVVIICLWNKDLPRIEKISGFQIRRIEISTRRLPKWVPLRLAFVLFELMIKFIWISYINRADFYHSHDVLPLPIAFVAGLLNRSIVIYDSHELEIDRSNVNFFTQKLLITIEGFLIRKVDDIIISDGGARAEAMLTFHQVERSYNVIRNYPYYCNVDPQKDSIFYQILPIDSDSDVILYIGRRFRGRGLEKAITALGSLPEGVVFVLLGQSNEVYEKKLQGIAEKIGVCDRLFFLPPVNPEELVQYIAGSRISLVLIENISLSYYLSTPSKLYESIAAGIPVVASNFPEIERIVSGNEVGQVGLTVDPENITEVTSALNRFLIDDDFWQDCQNNAFELAKSSIDWKKQEGKLISIYNKYIDLHS